MKTLLQINSSLFSEGGNSSQLSQQFVKRWQAQNPGGRVIVRDLAAHPLPYLDATRVGAFFTPADARTPEQKAIIAESDALIDELKSADVLVLGLPMYNFGVPAQLKSYFDHIARAGVTFRYTATGPEGLLPNIKTQVFAARGGLYVGTPNDSQTPYVRSFLGFLGIRDVEFVYAEGLNMGPEPKAASLAKAGAAIEALAV